MTIGVGLLCNHGAVVGADRQWTAGEWKLEGGKVSIASRVLGPNSVLSLVTTGAGTSRATISGAMKAVHKHWDQSPDVVSLIESADTELASFYQKKIVPFAGPYSAAPHADILIAASSTGHSAGLWQTEDYALVESGPYCAIGAGRMQALTILARAYPVGIRLSAFAAAILAVDTLMQVKASDSNCGKDSDLVVLLHNTAHPIGRDWVRDAESLCERFASFATPGFLLRAIGEWGMEADVNLNAYAAHFKELKASLYAQIERGEQIAAQMPTWRRRLAGVVAEDASRG